MQRAVPRPSPLPGNLAGELPCARHIGTAPDTLKWAVLGRVTWRIEHRNEFLVPVLRQAAVEASPDGTPE
jgi:hypothetical protein